MSFSCARTLPLEGRITRLRYTLVLSGPGNNADPLYSYDKNNFQPRVAIAWSPSFKIRFPWQALWKKP